MKQYEYMQIKKIVNGFGYKWEVETGEDSYIDWIDDNKIKVLNSLGLDGWELCCFLTCDMYILKREIKLEDKGIGIKGHINDFK